jgi:spore coat polysaccharide biosynthesis protein SpsF (cytidylyltransferase family)
MKTLAILQARTSSSRLPGKVLRPILGEPMLFRQIERIRRARRIDRLIVATSIDRSDDVLASECAIRDIECTRGSLTDVLDRFVCGARAYGPDIVVRLTGDCPLADPELIDAILVRFEVGDLDYLTNADPPTYPDGLDVEAMKFSGLLVAHHEAKLPSEREHVTSFLRAHPERFRLGNLRSPHDLSAMRWTVDEPQDFEFVSAVYEGIYPGKPNFTTADVMEFLDANPQLQLINSSIERNEGLKKSIQKDAKFLARKV